MIAPFFCYSVVKNNVRKWRQICRIITRDRYREEFTWWFLYISPIKRYHLTWVGRRGTDAGKRDDFFDMRTRQIFDQYVRLLDAIIWPGHNVQRRIVSLVLRIFASNLTKLRGWLIDLESRIQVTPAVSCLSYHNQENFELKFFRFRRHFIPTENDGIIFVITWHDMTWHDTKRHDMTLNFMLHNILHKILLYSLHYSLHYIHVTLYRRFYITSINFHITFHVKSQLNHIISHNTTLHHITFHYIKLHYIAFHHISSHYITRYHMTLHDITCYNLKLHDITWHYITLHHITLLRMHELWFSFRTQVMINCAAKYLPTLTTVIISGENGPYPKRYIPFALHGPK